jgi:hypothetical protein
VDTGRSFLFPLFLGDERAFATLSKSSTKQGSSDEDGVLSSWGVYNIKTDFLQRGAVAFVLFLDEAVFDFFLESMAHASVHRCSSSNHDVLN